MGKNNKNSKLGANQSFDAEFAAEAAGLSNATSKPAKGQSQKPQQQ
ncbi:hypothetical protein MH117_20650 [Paenibacillus sp. ACRRX]|nr:MULTISPECIES: hypothetical protein [unclassified Paenibacillus]MCG7409821.1 hypothetical protein [Paenibacillus sp. ACRRX]MDK8183111.1 hypothetical protein [Paenibacillus sp. UMB4589-SE434]